MDSREMMSFAVSYGHAMDNILKWTANLMASGDTEAFHLESEAWLNVDRPKRAHEVATGGCLLFSVLTTKLAQMYGLPPDKVIDTITIEFHGPHDEARFTMAAQIVSAMNRHDIAMAQDLLESHRAAGGNDALIDIGRTSVELIIGLLVGFPHLLSYISQGLRHGRN